MRGEKEDSSMLALFSAPKVFLAAAVLAALSTELSAHVEWTQVNQLDSSMVACYHFDGTPGVIAVGGTVPNLPGLNDGYNLVVTGAGHTTTRVSDVQDAAIFGESVYLQTSTGNQDLVSPASPVVPDTHKDLTIEFWFKWDDTVAQQTLTVGYQSGAKIRLKRDAANPANDDFGIEFVHGEYVKAPGFTTWDDPMDPNTVGPEEGSVGQWRHYALTIHSAGAYYDPVAGHDRYNAGTTAMLYINGHAWGAAPHTIDLGNIQHHDSSRIRVRSNAGTGRVYLDELTFWAQDLSDNGAAHNPFANGRGNGMTPPSWIVDTDGDGYSDAYEAARGWEASLNSVPPQDGSPAAIAANLLGDVNADGLVNGADLIALSQGMVDGAAISPERAGISDDGVLQSTTGDALYTVIDVTILGNHLAGHQPILR